MKTSILNRLFAAALITTITLTAFGKTASSNNTVQPVFNTATGAAKNATALVYSQILNQNLRVTYAVDNGRDITEDMNDWTFRFNGDFPGGEAQGWNDILATTGSWNMAGEEAGVISIMFSSPLSQPAFMSRSWTISNNTKGAEIVLIAADGDEVHLASDIQ